MSVTFRAVNKFVKLAYEIARREHDATKAQWNGHPYIVHPVLVARRLPGDDPLLQAAALLHDVVEDTPCTLESIEREFIETFPELEVSSDHDPLPQLLNLVDLMTRDPSKHYFSGYLWIISVYYQTRTLKRADVEVNGEAIDSLPEELQGPRRQKIDLATSVLDLADRVFAPGVDEQLRVRWIELALGNDDIDADQRLQIDEKSATFNELEYEILRLWSATRAWEQKYEPHLAPLPVSSGKEFEMEGHGLSHRLTD